MLKNLALVFVSPLLLLVVIWLCMETTLVREFMGFEWKFRLKRLIKLKRYEAMLLKVFK